jgi:hypothetical protein
LAFGTVDDDIRRSVSHSGLQSITQRRNSLVARHEFRNSSFGRSAETNHRKRILRPRAVTLLLTATMDQRPRHQHFATRDQRAGALRAADLVR